MKKAVSAQEQLDGFLAKYLPEIARDGRACLKILRARLPGATQLVYDNYNGLVIGFGPSEKASEAVFSLVLYPRYVVLFFLQGARIPDPEKLLLGSGKVVRHIRLSGAADLDSAQIQELMAAAIESARVPFDDSAKGKVVIRAASTKQRSRRPG